MIYLSIALVTLVFLFAFGMYHSCRQNKLITKKNKQLHDLCNQLDKQNKKYRTLFNNVEKKYGYCAARQAARQPGYEAQMFKLEPHSPSTDVKDKSIEVLQTSID